MKEPRQRWSVSDFDIHYVLFWSPFLHGDQRLEYTARLARTINILFIYLQRSAENERLCKKWLKNSFEYTFLVGVWSSGTPLRNANAGIPRHGECPTQRYFISVSKHFFPLCKRVPQWETSRIVQQDEICSPQHFSICQLNFLFC